MLDKIHKRMASLQKTIEKVASATDTPEIPKEIQDLIRDKFSFASDSNEKALEGAIALAKFGQYDRALAEFDALLHIDSHRMVAAKNIVRCHMSLEDFDGLIAKYGQWLTQEVFPEEQIANLKSFIQGMLDKKGIDKTLPDTAEAVAQETAEASEDMVMLELETPEEEIEMADLPEKEVEVAEPLIELPEEEDAGRAGGGFDRCQFHRDHPRIRNAKRQIRRTRRQFPIRQKNQLDHFRQTQGFVGSFATGRQAERCPVLFAVCDVYRCLCRYRKHQNRHRAQAGRFQY